MIRFGCIFVSALFFMLSGCTMYPGRAFTGKTVDATAIYSSLDGEGLGESPGAAWISDNEAFLSFMNRIRRIRLGVEQPSVPSVDFSHKGVLIVWMGRKPTGGYHIELAQDRIYMEDHTAVVTVRWMEPAEDAVLSQRITGPCLMIRMTRGDYGMIKVIDEKGIVRAETPVDNGEH